MDIYIYLCVLFALTSLLEPLMPVFFRKIIFFLNGTILIFIVGCRSCGIDYYLYESIIMSGNISDSEWPFLYAFLAANIKFQSLVFLTALFTIVPYYILFFKFSKRYYNYAAAFFFCNFFFMCLMQQSRQGIALACIAWALLFFQSYGKSIFSILIGGTIHLVSYIGLLGLFISKNFYRPSVYISIYLASLLLGSIVMEHILQNASMIQIIESKLLTYVERTEIKELTTELFSFRSFLYFCLIYFCYVKRAKIKNKLIPFTCNLVFFSVCWQILTATIPDLAVRGGFCYRQFFIFLLLFIIEEKGILGKLRPYFFILTWLYCVYMMISYLNLLVRENASLNLIPYSFL